MIATKPIRGVYREGRIELAETPSFPEGTIVTVAAVDERVLQNKSIRFGMFPGPPFSTEEDFREAEYHDPTEVEGSGK